MKIENLIKDCMMDVNYYALELYDWNKHVSNEKQNKNDTINPGSSLKIFRSTNGNEIHVLKSNSIKNLPNEFNVLYNKETLEMITELINKDFYFSMLFTSGKAEPIFPDEIWLSLDEAIKGCVNYL